MLKKQKWSLKEKLISSNGCKKSNRRNYSKKIKIKPKSYSIKFSTDQPTIREVEVKASDVKYLSAGVKILSGHI